LPEDGSRAGFRNAVLHNIYRIDEVSKREVMLVNKSCDGLLWCDFVNVK
jgi:hypothetical protein